MTLKEFIENFVCKNSLIRLWYAINGGHEMVIDGVSMDWETFKGEGIFGKFINNNVIGVTDILVTGHYTEAINIVIEKIPLDDFRDVVANHYAQDFGSAWVQKVELDQQSWRERQLKNIIDGTDI